MATPLVAFAIDVEPDELFLSPGGSVTWNGFEAAFETLESVRGALGDARFCWNLRLDPQIATLAGRADAVVFDHRSEVSLLQDRGDAIGIHVHPFRLDRNRWVVDYADADWVEQCLQISVDTFVTAFGVGPRVTSFGHNWLSDRVVARLQALGVEVDMSIEHGTSKGAFYDGETIFRGHRPSFEEIPSGPYRPSADDFRVPGADGSLWLLPLASVADGPGRRKVRLGRDGSDVDRLIADHDRAFALSVRSDEFLVRGDAIVSDLKSLVDTGAALTTPTEAVHLTAAEHAGES